MGVHPSLLLRSASVFPAGAGGEPCRGEASATLPLPPPPQSHPFLGFFSDLWLLSEKCPGALVPLVAHHPPSPHNQTHPLGG